jgi:mono/diheme cytochrome c family protein
MKLFLTTTILALAVTGSALADAAAGKALYATKCKMCHGANGEGNPGIAKALGVTPKPLASKEVQGKSDAALTKDIVEGIGKMKPVKLSDADLKDVIAFVRTLK